MGISAQQISKNSSLLIISLLVQKILSFVYFSYLATQLGVDQTGLYFFVLSLVSILSVFIDLGIINTLIKEVAQKPEMTNKYFNQAVILRLAASILIYIILLILAWFMNYDLLTKQATYIAGFIMIIDSFTLLFYGFLRGHHITKFEAAGNILFQVSLLIPGLLILYFNPSIMMALLVLLFASMVNFAYSFYKLNKNIPLTINLRFDFVIIKKIMLLAVPFALAGIFSRIYGYLDTFLLKELVSARAVGYYSLPYKITFVFQFIPLALIAALYPAFAKLFLTDKNALNNLFTKTITYLLLISIPISLGIYLLADKIFLSIYGIEYFASVGAIKILILSLPFIFLNFPLGYLLNACQKQKNNTLNIFIVLIVSLVANLVLIPYYSYIATSLISLISTMILTILGFWLVVKIIKFNWLNFSFIIFKLFLANLALFGIILIIRDNVHYLFTIIIAGLVYSLIAFSIKLIAISDIRFMLNSLLKKDYE